MKDCWESRGKREGYFLFRLPYFLKVAPENLSPRLLPHAEWKVWNHARDFLEKRGTITQTLEYTAPGPSFTARGLWLRK